MKPRSDIIFATGNPHKLREVREKIGQEYHVKGLDTIGCDEELPETQETLSGNAWQKAEYVYTHYQVDCFAEDTGLEVEALDGEPGVYSARYAGTDVTPGENIDLLLQNLEGIENRVARFRSVIALYWEGEEKEFEGILEGQILPKRRGQKGFGYDPVFLPQNFNRTLAEMEIQEKNEISHRSRALDKLKRFLYKKIKIS